MLSNRTFVRRRIKIQFILLHLDLFKDAEKICLIYSLKYPASVNTIEAKKIVQLARQKIGYSPKYIDCDLFVSLNGLYKKIMQYQIR